MDIKNQYNKIGKDYVDGREEFFKTKEDWSVVAMQKYLKNIGKSKILDIGCGGGYDLKILEQKGAEAFGIDPSQVMVNEAKKRVSLPQNIQIGDYENIPFSDKTFDIVFGRFSLHYLNNFDTAYQEIHRVLRDNGSLLLLVNHPAYDLNHLLNNESETLNWVELYNNKTKVFFPHHTLRDYFSPKFLELFDLIEINEYSEEEIVDGNKNIPSALLYYAVAR